MSNHLAGEEAVTQAAALTFTMLRFEQESAHQSRAEDPHPGRLGDDKFIFLPSWRSTPREDVVPFLASLNSPALLFPTTTRGVVSLILLEDLNGDRQRWAQKTFDNQLAGIDDLATQLTLDGNSKVLLEVLGDIHVVSIDVLRVWSQRFSAPVGWGIGDSSNDARAPARFCLIASDGRVNPPWTARAPWERPVD